MKKNQSNNPEHIVLTSHPNRTGPKSPAVTWTGKTLKERGPLIAAMADRAGSNVIGAYGGAYSVYRAVSVATGALDPLHVPDLHNTAPVAEIGPYPVWSEENKIVSLDPWGHKIGEEFDDLRAKGLDVRPTIAITKAHINMPELTEAIEAGRIKVDGDLVKENGNVVVTKAAIDPVWYLPGMAERLGVDEMELRRSLFENSGGMFSELVTRPDLKVFLPPIGGHTVYIFGDAKKLSDYDTPLACRTHDECNGSDVFGSDICTCRPYLCHGIEIAIETAQNGGVGVLIYNRKEGRALGEVTKFLVYNARKRQKGGDTADKYFQRTECVAGVEDMRFQELMPDVFHWLGIKKIDRFASMSNMKHDALVKSGIEIRERIPIPAHMVPDDAQVEIEAKKAAGYYIDDPAQIATDDELKDVVGRAFDE